MPIQIILKGPLLEGLAECCFLFIYHSLLVVCSGGVFPVFISWYKEYNHTIGTYEYYLVILALMGISCYALLFLDDCRRKLAVKIVLTYYVCCMLITRKVQYESIFSMNLFHAVVLFRLVYPFAQNGVINGYLDKWRWYNLVNNFIYNNWTRMMFVILHILCNGYSVRLTAPD